MKIYLHERSFAVKKILIANRGEIAARIIKTCKFLGIETVAVYSDADEYLPYVKKADISVRIGESPARNSYLNMELIIETAVSLGVDGIHPGYGFLSENSEFATKAVEAGLVFIGPSHETIHMMGNKVQARNLMMQAGVPVVPGTSNLHTLEEAVQAANIIGYPLMLKSSSGGGGIGMLRCENEEELLQSFSSLKKRAKSYFGDDAIFIEKCIDNARHIEVQIFGDKFGNYVHMFERNCSVQRRNQKVIEESPSPNLSVETRALMCEAALKAGKAAHYENAGTVEFIVGPDENFYFIEMNTRLQVEHPVTEMVTGIDLVEWQIKIASGEKLPLKQEEIRSKGHAIECRIYAEDPITFLPSPGRITNISWPSGRRIDTGYEKGSIVSHFYDPMIAKCIIEASTRKETISKTEEFLKGIKIEGIKTNIPLLLSIMNDDHFYSGRYTTNLIQKSYYTGGRK